MIAMRFVDRFIFPLLISMVITGCASITPANTPEVCPTSAPLYCPTVLAQVPPTPNDWRMDLSNMANLVFTFDPGDKCTMDVKSLVNNNKSLFFEIVVTDQSYENYIVAALTLDAGKTYQDFEAYANSPGGSLNPPPWGQITFFEIVEPHTSSWHGMLSNDMPLYFACFVQGPGEQRIINTFGPINILQ